MYPISMLFKSLVVKSNIDYHAGSQIESRLHCIDIYDDDCISCREKLVFLKFDRRQEYNARKVICSYVYSAYILKPVLSGRNL